MKRLTNLLTAVLLLAGSLPMFCPSSFGGELPSKPGYRALPPITQGELTIFPVAAAWSHDTGNFITLDEGLRSGEVVVTEAGRAVPLMRRRPGHPLPPQWRGDGAQVNRLVLVNNSNRPLILLAGEIVTGGKQDRVVGKDRIVPANSDPIDLGVFCVEPGRWVEASAQFKPMGEAMAQPSVRRRAMADKDQQKVWAEVHNSAEAAARMAPSAGPALLGTTSYAKVMQNEEVKKQVDEVAAPVERSFEGVIRHLRSQSAVGVVVAVRGEILWADLFASTSLLEKYWPKLARSYAAEAITSRGSSRPVDTRAAQAFLENFDGNREIVESEPGVYRHTEISGSGFKAFELTSLLPKTGFDLHISKMAE